MNSKLTFLAFGLQQIETLTLHFPFPFHFRVPFPFGDFQKQILKP